jgi:hypothetical protein
MRRLLPCILILTAAGCAEPRVRNLVDAGLTCTAPERLIDGECRFVCQRDRDCPSGQACDLLTGTCEPAVPRPDAGPPQVPCTEGATRCAADNKSVERCNDRGTWIQDQACPAGGYCLNERCLACQPGVRTCASPSIVSACSDEGSTPRTFGCADGASCTDGECRSCAPGATQCTPDGTAAQACTRQEDETLNWRWTNAGDAFDGSCTTKQCTDTSGTAACAQPDCFPGSTQCKSSTVLQQCSDTGRWQDAACSTQPGMGPLAECISGVCMDECVEAAAQKSYYGCEYWSAVQDNAIDALFKNVSASSSVPVQGTQDSLFAFVAANRSTQPATVEVYRWINGAEQKVKSVTVPGQADPATRGIATIYVPWQSIAPASNPETRSETGQYRYGYRVVSTRPIALYQFSPLDAAFQTGKTCSASSGTDTDTCDEYSYYDPFDGFFGCTGGTCGTCISSKCTYYTYSNDASLLLPSHILGTSHVAVSVQHKSIGSSSTAMGGHLTIVGTAAGTTVTVKSSAVTRASLNGPSIPAMAKGESRTFALDRYDVLQLATDNAGSTSCSGSGSNRKCRHDNDLTGTVVTSSAPVAVFGGAACSFQPYDKTACDHLEEQIFPFNTWGKNFVAVRTAPLRLTDGTFASAANAAADSYKVVASCPASQCPNGTVLQVSGGTVTDVTLAGTGTGCVAGTSLGNAAAPCRLMGGTFVEFSSKDSLSISADQPVAVAQFFAGQNATGGTTAPAQGDPSMVLLPPVEQWRTNYRVLAAPGIKDNYLGLVMDGAKVQEVRVDGVPVSGFTQVGAGPFKVVNAAVSVGPHTVEVIPLPGQAASGAGVTVYGFDAYVSYGYTGGLDLKSIVVGVNPGG